MPCQPGDDNLGGKEREDVNLGGKERKDDNLGGKEREEDNPGRKERKDERWRTILTTLSQVLHLQEMDFVFLHLFFPTFLT